MRKIIFLALFLIATNRLQAQTIPSYVPTGGLLAWYPFTGNPNDSSGFSNNGVEYGGVTYGTDRFGAPNSCFVADSFSAVDFPINNFPTGNAARTVSVFFKLAYPMASGQRELFAWGNNSFVGGRFGMELTSDTAIGWESAGGAVFSRFVADTFWHNLTITYPTAGTGTSSIKLYIDGEIAAITSVYSPVSILNTSSGSIHCAGSLFLTYMYGWYGNLDDIGVWDRELTPCEIETMYYGPNPLVPKITKAGSVLNTVTTYSSYQWLKNDTAVSGATTSKYTTTSMGKYKVAVVTPAGCSDTSLVYILTLPTQTNNSTVYNEIKIYPNPSASDIRIESTVKINIILSDVEGRVLITKEDAREVDLRAFSNGIYLLTIFDENGSKIKTERITKLSQ